LIVPSLIFFVATRHRAIRYRGLAVLADNLGTGPPWISAEAARAAISPRTQVT